MTGTIRPQSSDTAIEIDVPPENGARRRPPRSACDGDAGHPRRLAMNARKVRFTPRSAYSCFFRVGGAGHAGVVDLEDRVHVGRDPPRHHHVLGSELADPLQGSTRSPSQGSTAAAGAGARGCGAAGDRLGNRCGRGCAPATAGGSAAVDVADHVVLGDPPREPGARNLAQIQAVLGGHLAHQGVERRRSAPRRSPLRRCSRRHCRRGTSRGRTGGGRPASGRPAECSAAFGRRRWAPRSRLGRGGGAAGAGADGAGPRRGSGSLPRAGGRLGVDPRHHRLHRDGLALLHQDLAQHSRGRGRDLRPPCRWRSRRSARRA